MPCSNQDELTWETVPCLNWGQNCGCTWCRQKCFKLGSSGRGKSISVAAQTSLETSRWMSIQILWHFRDSLLILLTIWSSVLPLLNSNFNQSWLKFKVTSDTSSIPSLITEITFGNLYGHVFLPFYDRRVLWISSCEIPPFIKGKQLGS